jgi:Predicted nucleic acid-binding protein, contains PIN domain
MTEIFVDTNYLVALINPKDQYYKSARKIQTTIVKAKLYTSEMVMAEVLNYYAEAGGYMRAAAIKSVRQIFTDPDFSVFETTSDLFLEGLDLYEKRPDKGYSLTDCISMNIMHKKTITEILTSDSHFEQEGFQILL